MHWFRYFLTGLLLVGTIGLCAGKPFEGVINYKITYPDNKFSESQMAMFPKLLTVSVKGSKSRSEWLVSGMNSVEIKDHLEKVSVTLISIMGQKLAIRESQADIEKLWEKEGVPIVEQSTETRTIAGYQCKKVKITMDKNGVKTVYEAYYTTELGGKNANFDNPVYKSIDGVLLEFTILMMDTKARFTATAVEKKSLNPKDFDIPADYRPTTKEEFQSLFGAGTE